MAIATNLKPELLDKIILHLRSGEFGIQPGALRSTSDYSCMCFEGMVCELYREENGGDWLPNGTFAPPAMMKRALYRATPAIDRWATIDGCRIHVDGKSGHEWFDGLEGIWDMEPVELADLLEDSEHVPMIDQACV